MPGNPELRTQGAHHRIRDSAPTMAYHWCRPIPCQRPMVRAGNRLLQQVSIHTVIEQSQNSGSKSSDDGNIF